MQALAVLVSGEGTFPGSETASYVLLWGKEWGACWVFYGSTNLIPAGSALLTGSPPKDPLQTPSRWESGFHVQILEESVNNYFVATTCPVTEPFQDKWFS